MTQYEKIEKALDLKVGDVVKISHSVPSHRAGWNNQWEEDMDDYIGYVGELIERVGKGKGWRVDGANFYFRLPPKVSFAMAALILSSDIHKGEATQLTTPAWSMYRQSVTSNVGICIGSAMMRNPARFLFASNDV